MKKLVLALFAIFTITAISISTMVHADKSNGKYLVILQAGKDSKDGGARGLHALLYTKELKDNGSEVTLVFDGAGTTWALAMQEKDYAYHKLYKELENAGVVEIICDACSMAYKVKKELKGKGLKNFEGEFEGHPSIVKWVKKGYQIITL